jgi:MFS family permease
MVALLVLISRLPFWAAGWILGVYVDQYNLRLLILVTSLISASGATAILVLYAFSAINFWTLAIVVIIMAMARIVDMSALVAQLSVFAGTEKHRRMNFMLDNTKRVARLGAPLLAALLLGALPSVWLYAPAALGYCAMAAAIFLVKMADPTRSNEPVVKRRRRIDQDRRRRVDHPLGCEVAAPRLEARSAA